MIVESSMSGAWLSNSWLVGDRPGGHAVIVDTGGPAEPLLATIAAQRLRVTHVLCTHHHQDHVLHNDLYRERFGCPVVAHALEREHLGRLDLTLEDGEEVASGELRIRALHVPGHTVGHLAFVVGGERVFSGDTLFRRSVGGTSGPGASFEDLRRSILEVLLRLPPGMPVHPGHTDSTTIGEELEHNPFVRVWRGLDPIEERPCTAFGRPATLLLRARDYDAGTKCWVRFDVDGRMDVVPGSRVQDRR